MSLREWARDVASFLALVTSGVLFLALFLAASVGRFYARRWFDEHPTLGWSIGLGVVAAAVTYGGIALWRRRAASRRQTWRMQGRCLRCGYDLRTNPNRCPECGTLRGAW